MTKRMSRRWNPNSRWSRRSEGVFPLLQRMLVPIVLDSVVRTPRPVRSRRTEKLAKSLHMIMLHYLIGGGPAKLAPPSGQG